MDDIRVQILKSIPAFKPVTTTQLIQLIGCPKRQMLSTLAELRAAGRIFTKIPVGHFSSEYAFLTWLDNGGREYLSCRGRQAAARSNSSKTKRNNTIPCRTMSILLTHGTLRAVDIARFLGVPYNTLSGQLSAMVSRGQVIRTGNAGRSFYSVPPGVEAPQQSAISGNGIFDECRQNWQGYQIHKIFGSARA